MFSPSVSFTLLIFHARLSILAGKCVAVFCIGAVAFTCSWKAFLCTLLTEEFTCVSFWYLYVKASYSGALIL